MKRLIKYFFLLIIILMQYYTTMSQPDPGSGSGGPIGGGAPIGGGIFILLFLGAGYGLTRLYNTHKRRLDE